MNWLGLGYARLEVARLCRLRGTHGLYDLVGDLSLSLVIVIVLLQVLSLRAWRAALTL